jgi:rhodanese-related sulfurtransferase
MSIETIMKEGLGTIVDVRTPVEFSGGHVANSINVPLQELEEKMSEIESMKQPLILCCASGGRSASAEMFLKRKGIECYNAGSWLSVNYIVNQVK